MKKLFLLLSLALTLALSSCSSSTGIRPIWVDVEPRTLGSVSFVGSGEGNSEAEARSAAYRNALDKMGHELGFGVYDQYYRELSSTGGIIAFGTLVTDDFKYSIDDRWYYFILMETPEEQFYSARSPEYLERVSREASIKELLEEASAAYKDNHDMLAAEKTLQAVLISLDGSVGEEEYSPENLVAKAVSYVSLVRIDAKKNSRKASPDDMTFRIVRNKGLFKPPVEDAVVECTFQSINLDSKVVSTTQKARSGSNGIFVFNATDPYALHEGGISVRLYIDRDLLYRITLKGGNDLLAPLYDVLDAGVLERNYSYESHMEPSEVLVALAEYSYDGSLRPSSSFALVAEELFTSIRQEAPSFIAYEGDEVEDSMEYLLESYPGYRTIYLCRIGVTDRTAVGDRWYSRTEGQIVVADSQTGKMETLGLMSYATGGSTPAEADDNALRGQAQVTLGRLLSTF